MTRALRETACAMNPFRKPKTSQLKRYNVSIGVQSVDVEAESEDRARAIGLQLIREELAKRHASARFIGDVPSSYFGPSAWRGAIEATGRGEDFDRKTPDGWLTDGPCALRMPAGCDAKPAREVSRTAGGLITGRTVAAEPSDRGQSIDEVDIVKMGSRWYDERYLWLIAELFGDVQWEEGGEILKGPLMMLAGPLMAVADGECVALLMHRIETPEDVEPFEAQR